MSCARKALAVVAAPFLFSFVLSAQANPPNFTGSWQLTVATEGSSSITIQDASGKITFEYVVHDKDGKDHVSKFVCAAGGGDCDFDEHGHKSKVSIWFLGSSLNILKTNGAEDDATTQWKLEVSSDKKTLKVHREHLEPAGKDEDLVLVKATS